MKTMLMATDLSARSGRAFERALMLARHHQAILHVVHMIDDALPDAIAHHQKQAADQLMRDHIASLRAGAAPAITAEVEIGKQSAGILRRAKERQAELIILGVRDSLYESFFRGTTCEQIIRLGDIPVLVVKERPDKDYERVVVAVDFSLHSRRALEVALALAPSAEFHLLHAYQAPFATVVYGAKTRPEIEKEEEQRMEQVVDREMAASLGAAGVDAEKLHKVVRSGDVKGVIRREVERLKPDLLALGTHGRTGVAHAFLGSVAEELLRNPPCDSLAVKAW